MAKTVLKKDFIEKLDADLSNRNLLEVRDALSSLSKKDKERIDIRKRFATYYFYNGENAQAIGCFRALIHDKPEVSDSYINLFKVLQTDGRQKEALNIAIRAANKFPTRKEVNLEVAKLLVNQKKFTDLRTHTRNCLSQDENDLDYLLLNGDCMLHGKFQDQGRHVFEKCLLLARKSRPEAVTTILSSLAQVYYKTKESELLNNVLEEMGRRDDRNISNNKVLIEYSEKLGYLDKVK